MWNFTRKGASEAKTIANRSGTLFADYSILSGLKSQVLIITSVQWRHEGTYTCIVSSENSQIQAEASLNVPSECMVARYVFVYIYTACVTVPLSNLVIRGSNTTPERLETVTIECNVTANPPANIKWMKRTNRGTQTLIGNTPTTSITYRLISTPSGPTSSSTLIISNVEAADNGNYICEASNGLSPPTASENFTICVVGK